MPGIQKKSNFFRNVFSDSRTYKSGFVLVVVVVSISFFFFFFLFKIKYLYSSVFNTKFCIRFLGIMNTWIAMKRKKKKTFGFSLV